MIEAGKARALAVMAPQRNPLFPDVPTLKEGMGIDYSAGAWRGSPRRRAAGRSRPLVAAHSRRSSTVARSTREFMKRAASACSGPDGAGFAQFMDEQDEAMGETMKARPASRRLSADADTSESHAWLPDRATRLVSLVALGAVAAYGGSRLPPMPGQQIGPASSRSVIGAGLCPLRRADRARHRPAASRTRPRPTSPRIRTRATIDTAAVAARAACAR